MKRENVEKKVIRRYSESFKQEVVRSIECGEHSLSSAKRAYGVKGSDTIQGWIRKFGKLDLLNQKVRIEMPEEQDQIKLLEALVQTQLAHLDAESSLRVACKRLGEEVDSFKKKAKKKG